MDYKDTLLMPKTAFEMRGKLPSKEPLIQKRWQDEDLYGKMMKNGTAHRSLYCTTARRMPTVIFTWGMR